MEHLISSLENAPVVDRGEYEYFVHPVTDGIPLVEAGLMREIGEEITARTNLDRVDKILTAEAMGIHIATAVSLECGLPFVIARKRSYRFDDEVAVHQETGYGENELYINGVSEGDRLLVVDDVISTGNTLAALSEAVELCGAEIERIVVVIRRTGDDEIPSLPAPVDHLVEVDVVDGQVKIVDTP